MTSRRGALLVAGLVLASVLLYVFRDEVPETRRFVLALAAAGFFFAPMSERRLSLALWLPAVAAVAWGGRWAGSTDGLALWLACSVAGALVAVRGGGRAAYYYLPEARTEAGVPPQHAVRRQLRGAVVLYLAVYVLEGWTWTTDAYAFGRGVALFLAAAFFVRYLLLQAKLLGIHAASLPRPSGLVPAQRWPVLVLIVIVGGTRIGDRLLPRPVEGPLLVSSALLFLLAGLVFVLALARGGWSRRFVRYASFFAGMVLAVALAAVVVELEGWAPRRFGVFSALVSFFLVAAPFVAETTRLLEALPHGDALAAPPVLGVMMAPVTTVNGARWGLPSSGFLFALALVILVYWLLLALRSGGPLRPYLTASIGGMLLVFAREGAAWAENGSAWQLFLLALGCVLYSVDFAERARVAKAEAS